MILPLRIKDTFLLKNLRNNRYCGVNRVRNDEDESLWSCGGNSGGEVTDNASINLCKYK